jgi:hypothetical protein
VTRPRSKKNLIEYYEGQLSRLASNFAVSSDLALVLGGRLKFEEMLSGRMADSLGTLYLGYACLWYYEQNKHVDGIEEVFELAMDRLLKENETALQGVASNFPIFGIGSLMNAICFPTGKRVYNGPSDKTVKDAANKISTPSGIRDLLSQGIFISNDANDRVRMLNDALPLAVKADEIMKQAKIQKRDLTKDEQELVQKVEAMANEIIQVDVFDKVGKEKYENDDYVRPALRHTRFEDFDKVAVHAATSGAKVEEKVAVAASA